MSRVWHDPHETLTPFRWRRLVAALTRMAAAPAEACAPHASSAAGVGRPIQDRAPRTPGKATRGA